MAGGTVAWWDVVVLAANVIMMDPAKTGGLMV
jgi:hypothetical protein